MKTQKITRSIKRRIPANDPRDDEWFVTIGPDGLHFRRKRHEQAYFLSWNQAAVKAMALFYAHTFDTPEPFQYGAKTDPQQIQMFMDPPPPRIEIQRTGISYLEHDYPAQETQTERYLKDQEAGLPGGSQETKE